MTDPTAQRDLVRAQYGAIAAATASGCCGPTGCSGTAASTLGYSTTDQAAIPDAADLGLGCGNPAAIAAIQPGETVIDLGSGAGMDAFLAAERVGPTGRVIGVDMTPEMITRARQTAAAEGVANVRFLLGEIEALPVADGIADTIISNCVINLSPEKDRVFAEAFRALKPGGRLAISDVVALQPLPDALAAQAAALTGCVAGAATVDDLRAWLADAGFEDIVLDIDHDSRRFIAEWLPGSGAEAYVASAAIQARRPLSAGDEAAKVEASDCCRGACCD